MLEHWIGAHWLASGESGAGIVPAFDIALAVTDNQDGTGAVATITAGNPAAANTIYVESFSGGIGFDSWVSRGSIDGNGTVALSLPPGRYFAYAASNVAGNLTLTPVVYFLVTTGLESVHYRCKTAVQIAIQLLAIDGLDSGNVIVRKLPFARQMPTALSLAAPAVIVSHPGSELQQPRAGTNARDDIGYPVLVSILAADNQDLAANDDKYLGWRQRINAAFREQRLAGVPEVYTCHVEPGPITSPTAFYQNIYHSSLVLRFMSRQGRGSL